MSAGAAEAVRAEEARGVDHRLRVELYIYHYIYIPNYISTIDPRQGPLVRRALRIGSPTRGARRPSLKSAESQGARAVFGFHVSSDWLADQEGSPTMGAR